mmetsp:Transcript_99134/g.248504  ORF Transcript_99134/g.248504 Transcript_99134/m.248504 type:complete len:205 (-) Transcript_99134:1226-1840(-)
MTAQGRLHGSCVLHRRPPYVHTDLRAHIGLAHKTPAATEAVTVAGDMAVPSRSDGVGPLRQRAREPCQICAEAMNRPLLARRLFVAQLACLAKHVAAKTEEAKIHLCTALPIRRLKLEESCAPKVRPLACAQVHSCKIPLDCGRILPIGTIFTNEPWGRQELFIVLGDHLIHEAPRRLRVQAVDPPVVKGSLELCLSRPRRVVR